MYFWSNSHLVLLIMYFWFVDWWISMHLFLPNSIRALLFHNRIFHHVDFYVNFFSSFLICILWGQSILKTGGIVTFWFLLGLRPVCLGISRILKTLRLSVLQVWDMQCVRYVIDWRHFTGWLSHDWAMPLSASSGVCSWTCVVAKSPGALHSDRGHGERGAGERHAVPSILCSLLIGWERLSNESWRQQVFKKACKLGFDTFVDAEQDKTQY